MQMNWRWSFVVVSIAAFVAGCPKKNEGAGDAAPEAAASTAAAADAAPPTPALPTATNAADIARFGDEVAMNGDAAKIASAAPARKSPPSGEVVATLKPGTDVQKLAQRGQHFLVLFPNPKGGSDYMMGWVQDTAFSAAVIVRTDAGVKDAAVAVADAAPAPTPTPTPTPTTPPTPVLTDGGKGYTKPGRF
jgi:hypothetical protein